MSGRGLSGQDLERVGGAIYLAALCAGWPRRPCDLPSPFTESMSAAKRRWRMMRAAREALRSGPAASPLVAGRAASRRVAASGRVGRDVPPELARWAQRGVASIAMVRAAERFIHEYETGYLGGLQAVGYAERVDCGGSSDGPMLQGLAARERSAVALSVLGPLGGPIKAWLIDGMSAGEAVADGAAFSDKRRGSVAMAGVLLFGLAQLVEHYG